MQYALGNLKDLNIQVHELSIFKGEDEQKSEANNLQNLLNSGKALLDSPGVKQFKDIFLNQGIPLVPFPSLQYCLGLHPKDSSVSIQDGYVAIGYDYELFTSDTKCIFNMSNNIKNKEFQMLQKAA